MPPRVEDARRSYNNVVRRIIPRSCPLNGSRCMLRTDSSKRAHFESLQPYAFIMRQYTDDCDDMEDGVKYIMRKAARELGYFVARNRSIIGSEDEPSPEDIAIIVAKDRPYPGNGFCNICGLSLFSYFGIAELGYLNPNVLLEVGLMRGFSKPVILTLDKRLTPLTQVPFDLSGTLAVIYNNRKALLQRLRPYIETVVTELSSRNLL